jgi:hypothetical protein
METTPSTAIADYFVQAAGIPSPWRITQYQVNDVAKTVHLWITRHPLPQVEKKRNWFGMMSTTPSVSTPPAAGPDLHWRHLNCMDYTCTIHTVDQLDARHHHLPWFGEIGLPFTNRMSRQVFICLSEGMEMSALCAMLDIPFTDLWKFKFALDNGQVRFDYVPAKKAGQPTAAATAAQMVAAAELKPDGAVPDVANPVWEQLITGDLNIQIKTLSFQLILTKLRQQVSMQQNDEVKLMKLRELHRYVERNERSLSHELKQLREQSSSEPA